MKHQSYNQKIELWLYWWASHKKGLLGFDNKLVFILSIFQSILDFVFVPQMLDVLIFCHSFLLHFLILIAFNIMLYYVLTFMELALYLNRLCNVSSLYGWVLYNFLSNMGENSAFTIRITLFYWFLNAFC